MAGIELISIENSIMILDIMGDADEIVLFVVRFVVLNVNVSLGTSYLYLQFG